jgi:predicted N-acetyltransferase YhbS
MSALTALRQGLYVDDRLGQPVFYRLIVDSDDPDQLTALLHDAYGRWAADGIRFVASHQDAQTTRRRLARGVPIAAVIDGSIVGTLTVATIDNTTGSPFYDRPDVASVGQFAVAPALQNRGIGSTLMWLAEHWLAKWAPRIWRSIRPNTRRL